MNVEILISILISEQYSVLPEFEFTPRWVMHEECPETCRFLNQRFPDGFWVPVFKNGKETKKVDVTGALKSLSAADQVELLHTVTKELYRTRAVSNICCFI